MADQPTVWETWGQTPGGIVYSLDPVDQARILAMGFHRLVERLASAAIPMHFVAFPRMIEDAGYLFDCVRPCLPEHVTREIAISAHAAVADPHKVHIGRGARAVFAEADAAALRRELRLSRQREIEAHDEVLRLRRALEQSPPAPRHEESADRPRASGED
jgi:hypothetical protein